MKHYNKLIKWGVVPGILLLCMITGVLLTSGSSVPELPTPELPVPYEVPKRVLPPSKTSVKVEAGAVDKPGGYILKSSNGTIIIYPVNDPEDFYDTGIPDSKIPFPLRQTFREGYFISDEENLYGLLEDYTS